MKILISTLAMAMALAVTGPAFAGDVSKAKTEADCQACLLCANSGHQPSPVQRGRYSLDQTVPVEG